MSNAPVTTLVAYNPTLSFSKLKAREESLASPAHQRAKLEERLISLVYRRAINLEKSISLSLNSSALNIYTKRGILCSSPFYPRAVKKGVEFTIFLRTFPQFLPYAFDLALNIEQEGNKAFAHEIINQALNVFLSLESTNPEFLTPALTGKYSVGVKSYYLEDDSRNESHLGHEIDRTRKLLIDVHYPAVRDIEAPCRLQKIDVEGCPDPRINNVKAHHLQTRSQPGLHPVADKFPILFFSHGSGCDHWDYQHIVEEIASHGFYVITINHPFSSGSVPFLGHFQDPRIERTTPHEIEREIVTKAKDVEFVLDQVKEGTIKEFGAYIDLSKAGVIGHSQGGAASAEACRRNRSFKIGIDIDGPLGERPFKRHSIHQPFLTIAAGKGDSAYNLQNPKETGEKDWTEFNKIAPHATKFSIPDADHMDFTLNPMFFHAMGVGDYYCQTAKKQLLIIHKITGERILSFLTKHLQN